MKMTNEQFLRLILERIEEAEDFAGNAYTGDDSAEDLRCAMEGIYVSLNATCEFLKKFIETEYGKQDVKESLTSEEEE